MHPDTSLRAVNTASAPIDDDLPDSKQPESVAAVLKVFAILQALSERNETGVS